MAFREAVEPKREAFGAKLCLAPKTTRDASGPFKSHPRNHKTELMQFGFLLFVSMGFCGWVDPNLTPIELLELYEEKTGST